MITWGEIKLITLQKMFSANGSTIPADLSTRDYLASMPGAANEGLSLLSTAGKFIIKSIDIAHNPARNLLTNGKHIFSQERGSMEFSTKGARSFYFEYYGIGTYSIYVGNYLYKTANLTENGGYSPIKGLIPNAQDENIRLVFNSDYPLAVKNIALYSANFPDDDSVPSFAEKIRYPLKELAPDFYQLSTEDIYYEGDADVTRYVRTSDFFQEGNTVLVLDRDTPGNFKIYYKAYPQKITTETADEEELAIDDEVAALLCTYMASVLYLDDDSSIATIYRNSFEVGFDRLKDRASTPSAERFVSESGWI